MLTSEPPLSEAPTQTAGPLPSRSDRERRPAGVTAPRLATGRYLVVEDGTEVLVLVLGEKTVHLGRGTGADLVLDHMSVSRRHAVVTRRDEHHVLLDDRSRNGVFVNGARVGVAILRNGDEIALGDVVLRYVEVH